MASVLQQYRQLADHMATQITGSYQSWTDFLATAARLYKYPYHEQLMIYAQRPDATACADYELWNKRMGRYVRRGAKGIALIDHSGDAPKLKYVFDVADTAAPNAPAVPISGNTARSMSGQFQPLWRNSLPFPMMAASQSSLNRFPPSKSQNISLPTSRTSSASLTDRIWRGIMTMTKAWPLST